MALACLSARLDCYGIHTRGTYLVPAYADREKRLSGLRMNQGR